MSRRRLSRMKRLMKNSQRNAKSIIEVGRTTRNSEPMLIIKGYSQYVPDGIYLLSVECDEEHADVAYDEQYDMYFHVGGQYFVLSGSGKHYSSFPQAFEQMLSTWW